MLITGCVASSFSATPVVPWPTQGWPTSTPEAQGLHAARLVQLLDFIRKQDANVHSVLIVRHGYLVLEAYFYPFTAGDKHDLYSATKSVTSALVGIAIKDGRIDGVEHPVLDFFHDRAVGLRDARKEAMRLEDLLTMRSGLRWNEEGLRHSSLANSINRMTASPDAVQFVLDQPMEADPGQTFNYNSGASHLLSAIVQETTGKNTLAYARERLFAPLGISDVTWMADPQGIPYGSGSLSLTPRDMAKFGYLYLRDGNWDGQEIVPAMWVKASRTAQVTVDTAQSYGYQWWVLPSGAYEAQGWGSQHILVQPSLDLVVVFTGGMEDILFSRELLDLFIVPAIEGAGPLPPDAEGQAQLAARVSAAGAAPAAQPVSTLPATAQAISGKPYVITDGGAWRGFTLAFPGGTEAQIELVLGERRLVLAVGLDGVYRLTTVPDVGTVALYGAWQDDKTFVFEQQIVGQADRLETRYTFDGDVVEIWSRSYIEGATQTLHGKWPCRNAQAARRRG